VSAWGLWLGRGRRFLESRWFLRAALAGIGLPVLANASGWIFTEAGRQPWIVYGLMQTSSGVSSVPAADIALTLAVFVAVYTTLAVVAVTLILRAARHDFDDVQEDAAPDAGASPGLVY
jgi:cytochrome d ubiquinol oxidase subunit I